jgi:hypothetical protein
MIGLRALSPILMHQLGLGENPILWARDFTVTQALGAGGTCDRESIGYARAADGFWQSAAIDTARFDHDGTGWALLNEPPVITNLATYSNVPSNAAWSKSKVAVSGTLIESPDGTDTMEQMLETATTGIHAIYRSASWTSGDVVVALARIKPVGRTKIKMYTYTGPFAVGAEVRFTLTGAGSVDLQTNAIGAIALQRDGSYLVGIQDTAQSTGIGTIEWTLSTDGSTVSYAGDTSKGFALWGMTFNKQHSLADMMAFAPVVTASAAASKAAEAISWTDVPADNETRLVIDGADVDVDDWDGSLNDAAFTGRVASIIVYFPGNRPT